MFPKVSFTLLEKGQILLILPFLGPFSFEIRSCLQKCFKNYIPYCSLKVVYQFKNKIANAFNLKDVANTKLSSHTFINLCVVAATQLIITLLTDKLLKHLFLIICYWIVIKQVSTIFGYF